MQDGIDLITALAMHPETARRLARKFWNFFVSEIHPPDPAFVESAAAVYLQNGTEIRPVVRYILTSPWFNNPSMRYARYSWPVEYVTRAIKEVGWQNLSLDKVRSPLANMGQLLFEPPNVGGWPLGADWFSTGTMLARTNFAATLASSQKEFLAAALADRGRNAAGLADGDARSRDAGAPRLGAAAGADDRTCSPAGRGPAAPSSSTPEPPAWRACSSAPPNTSSFRRKRPCAYLDDSSSATASPPSRSGSPRLPS